MKIFFGVKTFYLVNNIDTLKQSNDQMIVKINSLKELVSAYQKAISNTKKAEIVFVNSDFDILKKWFVSMFVILEAAGGLVLNNKKEFLLIFRKGKWDLPKGKIEKNETIEFAAIREVEEECGISGLSIIKQIPATYHIYIQNEKTILKPTYWFEMKTTFNGILIPQLQEGITKVEWVKKDNVSALLPNAYESIREVMLNYL